jgi:hypothetical protein
MNGENASESSYVSSRETALQRLAGEYLEPMRRSTTPVVWLTHPCPSIRIAALFLVGSEWTITSEIRDACEELAFADADSQVRGVAISTLSDCYADTRDRRVCRRFAELAVNPSEPEADRLAALQGLYSIEGILVLAWPELQPGFRFPGDVDWRFVQQFLDPT